MRFLKLDFFYTHYTEWKAYHRIKEEQIFMPIPLAYDQHHPSITDKNHHHFVLYHAQEIVAIAHVEFLNQDEAVLRALATDAIYHNKGYGRKMMTLLEQWIKEQKRKSIKMHAALRAELFYRKLGYSEVIFNDPCITSDIIDLGKIL